jgi:hypothetical protein
MGRPRGTYGGTGDVPAGFEIREGSRQFARLRRRRKVVLKRILKSWDGFVDYRAQDRGGWQALVNAVMNLQVS